jgi:hypothetical protein
MMRLLSRKRTRRVGEGGAIFFSALKGRSVAAQGKAGELREPGRRPG